MYLTNELDNTIRVYALDGVVNDSDADTSTALQITFKQIISTLAFGQNRTAPINANIAADTYLSTDGKFAYAANRNTLSYNSDTLAVFAVHPGLNDDKDHLLYLGQNKTYGKIPRHFALSSDEQNRFVAVVNQVSNTVAVLERNATTGFFTGLKGFVTLGPLDVTQNLGPSAALWL
jgi:6-phosphogluconolactonase